MQVWAKDFMIHFTSGLDNFFFTLDKIFHDFISLVIFEIISSAGLEITPIPMHNSLNGNWSL